MTQDANINRAIRILIIDEVNILGALGNIQDKYPQINPAASYLSMLGKDADENPDILIAEAKKSDPTILVIGGSHVMGFPGVAEKVYKSAPNLKYIVRAGIGTDHVDKRASTKYGVKVVNEPFGNNESTAEWALRLMLAGRGGGKEVFVPKDILSVPTAEFRESHKQRFKNRNNEGNVGEKIKRDIDVILSPVTDGAVKRLKEKTVGILGFGNIGSTLAQELKKLSGQFFLDLKIKSFSETVKNEMPGVEYVGSAKQLFDAADVISIHIAGIPENKEIINRKLLKGSKTELLVNTTRDFIIQDEDLLNHLEDNENFRYHTDFPPVKTEGLLLHDRVLVSNHIAGLPLSANKKIWNNVGKIIETIVKQEAGILSKDDYPINVVNDPPERGWRT